MRRASAWIVVALCLSACADEATDQVVTVRSEPPGASCQVMRDNVALGTVSATPGSLSVTKGLSPLIVACSAAGYETITGGFDARYLGAQPFTTIGGQAPQLDARNYAYPDQVTITLRR
jgi:hypothetical protein